MRWRSLAGIRRTSCCCRWALLVLVVTHLYLMRRHGIAGPARPRAGIEKPFYPYHAVKDLTAITLVFAALMAFAVFGRAPLDALADPADSHYIPRPEWYFLGLFELLKFFPGRFEPIAAIAIPALLVVALALLPFMDRHPERHPGTRTLVLGAVTLVVLCIVILTTLGLRDVPAAIDANRWGPRAIAGRVLATNERCTRCHQPGGLAADLATAWFTRDDHWIVGHVSDPEMIAPGLRPPPEGALVERQGEAVVAYIRKLRAGSIPPQVSPDEQTAAMVFSMHCVKCHIIDGDGGTEGPNLSRAGAKHDLDSLIRRIRDPTEVDPDATMPAFEAELDANELRAVAEYLARRK